MDTKGKTRHFRETEAYVVAVLLIVEKFFVDGLINIEGQPRDE